MNVLESGTKKGPAGGRAEMMKKLILAKGWKGRDGRGKPLRERETPVRNNFQRRPFIKNA